ncbi:hypothetical protein ASG52_09885 [Methylobacterium sp. Leaf456]|uniref:hypothetical protein n=1 Tax=Methylobacterium sp. Leaf456 TaxID=1736382 RepID=UPI0006FCBCB5|nr:hypothetical protein [Methylobacterium sp. Leaf456]KQT49263.1 hypothetical protein ASG52_09885 [Methylobacterium sp. Leaf456]
MTNRHMVKPDAAAKPSAANRTQPPPMPAPEDSRTPTTQEEPIDSPQPNASAKREAPKPGEIGLAAGRDP